MLQIDVVYLLGLKPKEYNTSVNSNNLDEIVLGIVSDSKGQVLIAQRAKAEKGKDEIKLSWVFPGGKIEGSETKEQTVGREVLEETGFKVRVDSIVSERQHPQFPVYIYYVGCKLEPEKRFQEPTDPEIKTSKFVDPKNLVDYFTTDLDPNVKKYLGL